MTVIITAIPVFIFHVFGTQRPFCLLNYSAAFAVVYLNMGIPR